MNSGEIFPEVFLSIRCYFSKNYSGLLNPSKHNSKDGQKLSTMRREWHLGSTVVFRSFFLRIRNKNKKIKKITEGMIEM